MWGVERFELFLWTEDPTLKEMPPIIHKAIGRNMKQEMKGFEGNVIREMGPRSSSSRLNETSNINEVS
jgi:hypothetical protein